MRRGWVFEGQMPLHSKSKGVPLMVSDIVGEEGLLRDASGISHRVLLLVGTHGFSLRIFLKQVVVTNGNTYIFPCFAIYKNM